MDIILDANIIKEDFSLKSSKFRALFDFVKKSDSNIILIDIVVKEVLEHYENDLRLTINEGNKFYKKINSLLINGQKIEGLFIDIESEKDLYADYVLNRFKEISCNKEWKVINHNDNFLNPIIEKAIKKEKPFSDSGKGFKDAVLWECIKHYCSKIGYGENVFISLNKNDFGNVYPNELFEVLKNEADEIGIHLNYYTSLQDFLKDHTEKISFVNLDWVKSKLDYKGLAKHIIEGLNNNNEILASILEENGFNFLPNSYLVVGANNISVNEYSIYPFNDNEFLITLKYTVNLVIANGKSIRVKCSFINDSIYKDDMIHNFSPMENKK